ncbi:unnamed protein product [Protopolystoma xenopodis]|uniref:Uncharacterized protein n=1 Tax=Protopolystoma xenopodis TaxID=117903 RepID=A0A3S4ZVI3_9PLAT|nr:unnamed protein product [Protopolystoma xenopodis]
MNQRSKQSKLGLKQSDLRRRAHDKSTGVSAASSAAQAGVIKPYAMLAKVVSEEDKESMLEPGMGTEAFADMDLNSVETWQEEEPEMHSYDCDSDELIEDLLDNEAEVITKKQNKRPNNNDPWDGMGYEPNDDLPEDIDYQGSEEIDVLRGNEDDGLDETASEHYDYQIERELYACSGEEEPLEEEEDSEEENLGEVEELGFPLLVDTVEVGLPAAVKTSQLPLGPSDHIEGSDEEEEDVYDDETQGLLSGDRYQRKREPLSGTGRRTNHYHQHQSFSGSTDVLKINATSSSAQTLPAISDGKHIVAAIIGSNEMPTRVRRRKSRREISGQSLKNTSASTLNNLPAQIQMSSQSSKSHKESKDRRRRTGPELSDTTAGMDQTCRPRKRPGWLGRRFSAQGGGARAFGLGLMHPYRLTRNLSEMLVVALKQVITQKTASWY